MSDSKINTVVILDSIPTGELNTARRLHEDLEVIKHAKKFTPGITYARIETERHLFDCLNQLHDYISNNDILPLIHLEAHGCEDGIQLADSNELRWTRLKEALLPLNIAMELNLMLVLGLCYGGTFVKALDITDRAPIWGLIGPTNSLSAGQIEVDFGAFYKTLFSTMSFSEALTALNRSTSNDLYYRRTAEKFFLDVWKKYKESQCSLKIREKRAKRMYKKAKRRKTIFLRSVGYYKRLIKSQEPNLFNTFRDTYFMYDLFPHHDERFKVTYKKAEAQILE